MTKLSFIVPVYNVAPYLRKCVDSLLAQDYQDYEIILVDDGSTDGSGAICEQIVESQKSKVKSDDLSSTNPLTHSPAITVIHQSNAGLSAARNSGIKVAQGEYICFVDSDDYWEPNVLGGLMAQIERNKLEVLRYRIQYVNPQYEVFNPYKSDPYAGNDYSEMVTDGVTFLNTRMNTQCYAWQFIVSEDLLSNSEQVIGNSGDCLFAPGIYFEDTDWTPRMLVRAKRVASTETVVYNYLMREGSITNAVNRSKQKKVLDDKMRLVSELQRQAAELAAQGKDNRWFRRMIADTVISIIGILSVSFYNERKAYLAQLKQMDVYPIQSPLLKARMINLSPRLAVEMLFIKRKLVKNITQEFVRFCIVGAIAMGLHYAIYLFLLWLMGLDWSASNGADWRATLAYTIGYVIALAANMLLTARFTFRERLSMKRGGGFLLSHAINYVLEIGLLNLFLALHCAEWLSPLLVLLISVPVNFILVRTAFKKL